LIVDGSGTTYLATASNPVFKLADNGSNVLALTKNGAGTLHLESANSYSGLTTVNTGVLRITNGGALGATGTAARTEISGNENTGRLELSGGITTGETFRISMRQNAALDAPALSNFSGNNTITGDIQGVTGGSRINIESQAGLLTLSGNLSQTSGTGSRTWQLMGAGDGLVSGIISNGTATNLGIRKTGAGTWTLSGTNTYTGTTSVNQGMLVIDGDNTSATGNLSVASAATLGGSGTIGGAVNVTGILAPGNSIDTLTVNNDVTWTGAAAASSATDWQFELGLGTADLLDITGGASDFLKSTSLGSVFRFDFLGTGEFNDTYTLVSWDNSTNFSALDFSYANLASGKTGSFAIVGSSLEFTVVPEPKTAALLGAFGIISLLRRRKN
jgi:autotransporter-associated beta strand protein